MKFFKILLPFILISIILFNVCSTLYSQREKYLTQNYWQTFPKLEKIYLDSQYVNKNPKGWIPDETLNAYAGGAQIKGVSPILINPDTPPLGRYIIGFSVLLFNNANILNIFFILGTLGILYLVGLQIFNKHFLALLPPLFLSFEPLFLNQIVYTPLLDIMQLFFLLCCFYFFNKGLLQEKRKILFFILTSLFTGFFISTKFYITGFTIIAAYVITLLLVKRPKDCLLFLLTTPIAVFVLLISYIPVLFHGYPLSDFLGIQKYVFDYRTSQLRMPFTVWDLLFFNRWHVWFGDVPILSDAQWRISWPIATILTFLTPLLWLAKKVNVLYQVLPLICWVVIYLIVLSTGESTVRYFVILIPVIYLVALYSVIQIFNVITRGRFNR